MTAMTVSGSAARGRLVAYAACLILLVAFQQGIGVFVSTNTRLFQLVASGAHIPWFALVTLVLCEIGRLWVTRPGQRYFFIIGVALALAVTTEAAQMFTDRHASLADFGRNVLGMMTGLAIFALMRRARALSRSARLALVAMCLIAVSVAIVPAAHELAARLYLRSSAPDLIRVDSRLGLAPLAREANVSRVDGGVLAGDLDGTPVLLVRMQDDRRWPGIVLREPIRDWSGCEALVIRGYLPGQEGMQLTLRLLFWSEESPGPMAHIRFTPGANEHAVPLIRLLPERVGAAREIRQLVMYTSADAAGRVLGLQSLRLRGCEPD
jgi:hypothetical protein